MSRRQINLGRGGPLDPLRGGPMPTEHGPEPLRGLPGPLPGDETLLWQGAPQGPGFAMHALHARAIAIYFALLAAWSLGSALMDGADPVRLFRAVGIPIALALAALSLLGVYAWLTARTTVYSITNRRVVMRFGLAMPVTFNFPFAQIECADLNLRADGSGDIPILLNKNARIGWLLLWPHVRPWKMAHAQPMLRAIPDAARAAQILARALAASADLPAQAVSDLAPSARARGPVLA